MSVIKRFLLVFLLFAVPLGVLFAERYALVIGNSEYRHIQPLNTPVNDAGDIAATLHALGYQVDLRVNIGIDAMEEAVYQYADRLARDPANEGFFWYAGHGVQADGENFLLPVDIDAETVNQVKRASLSLSDLMMELQNARNRVNVVIIDACRNNPLPAESRSLNRGLAVMPVVQDTFIMFSTAAGATADDGAPNARNSPFTKAFLRNMTSPDALSAMARAVSRETIALTNTNQRPYISDNILYIENYSLNPAIVATDLGTDAPVLAPALPPQPAPIPYTPRPTGTGANVRDNWVQGEIGLLGLGVRYERMLNSNISLGVHAVLGSGGTSLWTKEDEQYTIFFNEYSPTQLSTDFVFRWYPWGENFFMGAGVGYHATMGTASIFINGRPNDFITSYQSYDSHESYTTSGIGFTPEIGWQFDPGNAGDFFMELTILGSISVGENSVITRYFPANDSMEIGYSLFILMGLGGAF